MGCCGRAGHAGWPKGDCLQGRGITQKPGSRSAGKEANGVSKALLRLRRVNHERGEVAYRAGGETAEEHRALVVSSHLELELELELAHPHIAHRTCHMSHVTCHMSLRVPIADDHPGKRVRPCDPRQLRRAGTLSSETDISQF